MGNPCSQPIYQDKETYNVDLDIEVPELQDKLDNLQKILEQIAAAMELQIQLLQQINQNIPTKSYQGWKGGAR